MRWLIVLGLLILCCVFVTIAVIRYNRLSLAFDLVQEANRQLVSYARERLALVPAFIEAARAALGGDEAFLGLERADALVEAGRASETFDAAAEQDLSQWISEVAERLQEEVGTESFDKTVALDLVLQLVNTEARIGSAVRYYNLIGQRYQDRLEAPLSAIFRMRFPAFVKARYAGVRVGTGEY